MVFYAVVNTIRDYVGGTYIYIYIWGGVKMDRDR